MGAGLGRDKESPLPSLAPIGKQAPALAPINKLAPVSAPVNKQASALAAVSKQPAPVNKQPPAQRSVLGNTTTAAADEAFDFSDEDED